MKKSILLLFVIGVFSCNGLNAQKNSEIQSLGAILNADGTINTGAGVSGSFNPAGYRMDYGANGQPVFRPMGIEVDGDEYWDDRFFGEGTDGIVRAIAIAANGDVYLGGDFTSAGGVSALHVVKWNGTSFQPLGSGLDGTVCALAISSGTLYAGGSFTGRLKSWNGSSWINFGDPDSTVYALAVNGSDIYAGGWFTHIGGISAQHIAKWNGSSWTEPSGGLNNLVRTIVVSGSDVYAGGDFTMAGIMTPADHIAKWNGSMWSSVGSGVDSNVYSIAISGSNVYAGGVFQSAGGNNMIKYIAVWNGTNWESLGTGLNSPVSTITIIGSDVYAGGIFNIAGGIPAKQIARWNGTNWSALSSGLNNAPFAMAAYNGNLYVGGGFSTAGNIPAKSIACWSGVSWKPLSGKGTNDLINALAVVEQNAYAGGNFTYSGDTPINRIARWNGAGWDSLNGGLNGDVNAIAVSGNNVYVGGSFTDAGGNPNADGIALWNGSSWNNLGTGINGIVYAIAVSGTNVFVGGDFLNAGGTVYANRIARWDGSQWHALGSGLNNRVHALAVSGSDVYVGGYFVDAGNVTAADGIARWDGSQWHPLGTGLDGPVHALAFSGSDLYVGGAFTDAGGNNNADRIARWDGTGWHSLGAGIGDVVYTIAVNGSDVYVGGNFTYVGGKPNTDRIVKWNGLDWEALGSGIDSYVNTIVAKDTTVFVGGDFTTAGGKPSLHFGIYHSVTSQPFSPTNLVFSNVTQSSIKLTFNKPPGITTGYLILRNSGSAPTSIPNDRTTYSAGGSIGDGTIIYVGPDTTFTDGGLSGNTNYFYKIFSYNGSGNLINYNPVALQGNQFTMAFEPTAQPTNIEFHDVGDGAIWVRYHPASGSPTGYIAIRSTGSAPVSDPVDGMSYTRGQIIGGTDTVAFAGSSYGFQDTGLTANTMYYYKIYSYNGTGLATNYLTVSPLSGNRSTLVPEPTAQPTSIVFSNIRSDSMQVSFTAASPAPTGYIAIRRAGSAPDSVPRDGIVYSIGNTISNGTVAYVGSSLSFSDTGLTANTVYYYTIFSYNGTGEIINYLTTSPLSGNRTTLQTQPTAQPKNIKFSNIKSDSLRVTFTEALGSPASYIAIRSAGSAPVAEPVDGTTYTIGQIIGGTDTVAYVGSDTTFINSGLAANTMYYYIIYSYYGEGLATNYLTLSPLSGYRSTLYANPQNQPTSIQFSNVQADSMRISFTAAVGGATGYIAIRKINDYPSTIPQDGHFYGTDSVLTGTDVVAYQGPSTTFLDDELMPSTNYYYRIYSYNGTDTLVNYLTSVSALSGNRSTLAAEPPNPPSNITFKNIQPNSFVVKFTPPSGIYSGFLAIRGTNQAPTGIPVDGMNYSVGQTIGGDTIVHIGLADSIVQIGLVSGYTYHYKIFSYNGAGILINYLTSNYLSGTQTTLVVEPSSPPQNFRFSDIQASSMTIAYDAAPGGAAGYLVLRKEGSLPAEVPEDAVSYSRGSSIGNSTVAYVGDNLNFSDFGLSANTDYYYKIFSYNGLGGLVNYKVDSWLAGHHKTLYAEPTNQPTNLQFSNVSTNSMTLTYSPAIGTFTGYIALRKAGSAPSSDPVDGQVYTVGSTIGDGEVVLFGNSTTISETGLLPNTVYYYKIYTYAGLDTLINYRTINPLSGNRSTLVIEPTATPTNLSFANVQANSMDISFTAAGSADGYLVLRQSGTAPTNVPADGISYTSGQFIGSDQIVYIGSGTSFSQSGLTAQTNYYYRVFAYNGSGQTINYLTTSFLSGNQSTLYGEPSDQPTSLAFSEITPSSIRISFNSATGNPTGYLVVRGTAEPVFIPIDGIKYTANQIVNSDRIVYVGTGTMFTDNGLMASATYYYKIFSFNASTPDFNLINYKTDSPLTGHETTDIDNIPPLIDSIVTSPRIAVMGQDVQILAYVKDNFGVDKVWLYYKKGNAAKYDSVVMTPPTSGNGYTWTMDDSLLSIAGVLLKIRAEDLYGNTLSKVSSFQLSVASGSVTTGISGSAYLTGLPASPKGTGERGWLLVSVPLQLTNPTANIVFSELGTYNKDWKIYDDAGGTSENFQMAPGKGYWLKQITGNARAVSLGTGIIVPLDSFEINLTAGWHMIGNPYPVEAVWKANSQIEGPIRRVNDGWQGQNQEDPTPVTVLKPFEGYWVNALQNTKMVIYPKENFGTGLKLFAMDKSSLTGWYAQFRAETDGLKDLMNFIGASSEISGLAEPPGMGDYVKVSFDKEQTPYTIDIRSLGQDGYTWDMTVQSNITGKPVQLDWRLVNLPEAFMVRIFDIFNNRFVDANADEYAFINKYENHPVKFKILIGTKEYVDGEMDKIRAEIPQEFVLHPNYPNPFNPQTTIRYDLAKTGKVELKIYNVLGQEVRTLIANQIQETGKYTINWDGRDNTGKMVSSGMYIYRLRTNDFVKSRKMILVR